MLSLPDLLLRLGNAVILGGLVGCERARRDRPAGLRTHVVVALAAATFMVVSIDMESFLPRPQGQPELRFDPGRIASYVVAGMGFLGAGTIVRSGGGVKGLTTAGTLWMVSALGLAAGAGMYAVAWAGCVLGLVALTGLRPVEDLIDRFRKHPYERRLRVVVGEPGSRAAVLALCEALGARVKEEGLDLREAGRRTTLHLTVRLAEKARVAELVERLASLPGVERIYMRRGIGSTDDGGAGAGL